MIIVYVVVSEMEIPIEKSPAGKGEAFLQGPRVCCYLKRKESFLNEKERLLIGAAPRYRKMENRSDVSLRGIVLYRQFTHNAMVG